MSTSDHFVTTLEEERAACLRGKIGKRGLCGKLSLQLFELQPQPSGAIAFKVARLSRGLLRTSNLLTFEDFPRYVLNISGWLSPALPLIDHSKPGLIEGALIAIVEVGTQRMKQVLTRRVLKGPEEREPGFCCSTCGLDLAFEELALELCIRG